MRRYCPDCKHQIRPEGRYMPQCTAIQSMAIKDSETGNTIFPTCFEMRDTGPCGLRGYLFKHKLTLWQRIKRWWK